MKTDSPASSVQRVAFCFISLAILTVILLKLDGENEAAAAELNVAQLTAGASAGH